MRNLFTSTVAILNTTSTDCTDLKIKVYTGNDTLILTERTEVVGTLYGPKFSEEFLQSIHVAEGGEPTANQTWLHYHQREYVVPVFNRGQRLVLRYLTTFLDPAQGPSVWLDMLYPGLEARYRKLLPEFYGVPVRLALPLGLFVCLLVFLFISLFITKVWAGASIALVAGLMVQPFGAWIYKGIQFLKKIFLH